MIIIAMSDCGLNMVEIRMRIYSFHMRALYLLVIKADSNVEDSEPLRCTMD